MIFLSIFYGKTETKIYVYLDKWLMMNDTIIVNDDDYIKWDIYFTAIKIMVGQEPMMHASLAQIFI
jgi:hypothetical protein